MAPSSNRRSRRPTRNSTRKKRDPNQMTAGKMMGIAMLKLGRRLRGAPRQISAIQGERRIIPNPQDLSLIHI